MRRFLDIISSHTACLFLSFFFLLPSALAEEKSLVFGVFPYLTPRQMVDQFAPLKEHIARELGHPVTLSTAQDYKNFIERTSAGEYDFILMRHIWRGWRRSGMVIIRWRRPATTS